MENQIIICSTRGSNCSSLKNSSVLIDKNELLERITSDLDSPRYRFSINVNRMLIDTKSVDYVTLDSCGIIDALKTLSRATITSQKMTKYFSIRVIAKVLRSMQ